MTTQIAFYMSGGDRQILIHNHMVYFNEAQRRLLCQFNSITNDADVFKLDFINAEKKKSNFKSSNIPDLVKHADLVKADFFLLLENMRDQTYLSVAAGMYHGWDKQLRDWLSREVAHWCNDAERVQKKIWSVQFHQMRELIESLCKGHQQTSFTSIEALNVVVNAYKHGEGQALEKIKTSFPQYLRCPFDDESLNREFADHTNLAIDDLHLKDFAEAIERFWNEIPDRVPASNVSSSVDWFWKILNT
jgi:hypothetical protein